MSGPTALTGTVWRALWCSSLLALMVTDGSYCETRHHEQAVPAAPDSAPPSPPTLEKFQPTVLVPAPFCEASAALTAPWDDDLVLVADNERHEQLYGFKIDDAGALKPDEIWQMPAKHRPRDIEALARLGEALVVVGSHSRNKSCEPKENRQSLRRLAPRQDGTLEETGFVESTATWKKAMEKGRKRCLSMLFTSPPPVGASEVCEALVAAEKGASEDECEVLNIEGAFGTGDGRLWLGLRAPLASGRAVLLRLVRGFDELRFDRVTLLDLEGRGIRELALKDNLLYGLAGPPQDARVPFALFRAASLDALSGGEPAVEILRRDLVTSSEGLLIRDGRAYVLVDGDAGSEDAGACQETAKWYVVELP